MKPQTPAAGPDETLAYKPGRAAQVSGRSRARIYRAIKDRKLPARKDGASTLILRSDLERWLKNLPEIGQANGVQ